MTEKLLRPAWVEIDLDAIEYNAKNIKALAGNCECMAVVKGDAYGLGAPRIAKVHQKVGIKHFAVANLVEAIELRESGIKDMILILGIEPGENAREVVENDISVMISSYENAKAFNDEAAKQGKKIKCFVALDTGMCRIGYDARKTDLLVAEVKKLQGLSNLELYGLHSHLCTADETDKTFSYEQMDRFKRADQALQDAGIKFQVRMIANSSAIIDLPETLEYEMCRPGFILYGILPSDEVSKDVLSLKPAMSVKCKIVYLKTIEPGDTVGYGRMFTATKPTVVATLPIGFLDGFPRGYSSVGEVLIEGKRAKILGNICMDACMVDVTDIPDVKVGDEVVIMGIDGDETITLEEINSKIAATCIDEIFGHLKIRMPRVYVKSSDPNYWEILKK